MWSGINFGANITGGEGGATHVVCDDLGNNRHYTLVEVDAKGAAVYERDTGYRRVHLSDLNTRGIEVLDVGNQILRPGEILNVSVGSLNVRIEGTSSQGVLLNGSRAEDVRRTDPDEKIRYPR